jgi:hypothetical protein
VIVTSFTDVPSNNVLTVQEVGDEVHESVGKSLIDFVLSGNAGPLSKVASNRDGLANLLNNLK